MRSPILKPVDFNKNEPVWVITDSSRMGIGAMYGQGANWDTCQPAEFLSKKFTSTQHNYCTHKHKTLTVGAHMLICIYAQSQSKYISVFSLILFLYYFHFTVRTLFQFFPIFSLFFLPFYSLQKPVILTWHC